MAKRIVVIDGLPDASDERFVRALAMACENAAHTHKRLVWITGPAVLLRAQRLRNKIPKGSKRSAMTQSAQKPPSRFSAGVAELRREFKLADQDHDGRVDFSDFRQLLIGLEADMSEQEMRIGFHEVDTDRDGLIDQQEFTEWWNAD